VYVVDTAVKNASSVVYTILRAAADIRFPNGETIDVIAAKELGLPEAETSVRCPPHTQRLVAACKYEIDKLHHSVFVVWRIQYREARWLGLAVLGKRDVTVQYAKPVPVEAQSLALYTGSRKRPDDD
jgi:hypothetical protein